MRLSDLCIAEVAHLPWPHGLFRCGHKELFDRAIRGVVSDRTEDCQSRVEALARNLSPAQLGQCPYHRPDWRLASDVAIDCWRECAGGDISDAAAALARRDMSEETAEAAWSFFVEPIWVDGLLLGNGQHRVCAMKLSLVEQCLIEAVGLSL